MGILTPGCASNSSGFLSIFGALKKFESDRCLLTAVCAQSSLVTYFGVMSVPFSVTNFDYGSFY